MKSLPLPRDVEDTAIAAVSRPSVCDVDRSSIGALQRGERAGDSPARRHGANRQSRSAFRPPPAVAIPWPRPDVSGEPSPRCRPIVRRRLRGCEDGPERRRGPPADRPLPGAPSGDPTPITQSVEELVLPTPFLDFPVTPLARLEKHGFFNF